MDLLPLNYISMNYELIIQNTMNYTNNLTLIWYSFWQGCQVWTGRPNILIQEDTTNSFYSCGQNGDTWTTLGNVVEVEWLELMWSDEWLMASGEKLLVACGWLIALPLCSEICW